jgi:hypothetical protein
MAYGRKYKGPVREDLREQVEIDNKRINHKRNDSPSSNEYLNSLIRARTRQILGENNV